ncbi:winged helix-turn-helix domain-containing protein [Alteromonadaceae bacterium BrNp21-10]|nr:winged helix-turn-helix domain-containing protein [Alteromonadaceae bacterium BrNp21-10]
MNTHSEDSFTLENVLISPSHNQMEVDGETIKLQPKVMSVLLYLAQHYDRVISNDELIENLWAGRVVNHGSVQKSINSLRTTFADIFTDKDVIENFSKKGYQLTIRPVFLTDNNPTRGMQITQRIGPLSKIKMRWLVSTSAIVAVMIYALVTQLNSPQHLSIKKQHKMLFSSVNSYTADIGHEQNAVPHPDNQHVAYVKNNNSTNPSGTQQSQLIVGDQKGSNWSIAHSNGIWFKYAWSPDGQHLAAIEQQRIETNALTPDFYEKPNYLYTFHVFSLDLKNKRLIEKHLLSQWQGQLNSIGWVDNMRIEFVAMQGNNSHFSRFHYSPFEQQLVPVEPLDFAPLPVSSSIVNGKTAITSRYKQQLKIDFVDENQQRFATYPIPYSQADVSWVPDGSGVLVHAPAQQKMFILYLDGQQTDIPLQQGKNTAAFSPRFSADGQKIYYTESHLRSEIWSNTLSGNMQKLIDNQQLNYAASYAAKGDKYVYASVRSNQIQLWLVENGAERQLTRNPLEAEITKILWVNNDQQVLYKSGSQLVLYNLSQDIEKILLSQADNIFPVALNVAFNAESGAEQQTLTALIETDTIQNLWRINLNNDQRKQLTFGSIGSALSHQNNIYFQYTGQNGLWVLHEEDETLTLISDDFDKNSKLLYLDNHGLYYITGGECRESDIFYKEFASGAKSIYLTRENSNIKTSSFHPQQGDLHTKCEIPESNILTLE